MMMKMKSIKLLLFIVLALSLHSCAKKVAHLAKQEVTYMRFDNKIMDKDQGIETMIKPYKNELDAKMNIVIGEVTEELMKEGPTSRLPNWFTDVMLNFVNDSLNKKADLCIQNMGGIRVNSLPKGDFTIGKAYEIMPFDNQIAIMKVNGNTLREVLNKKANSRGFPVSNSCYYEIKDSTVQNIKIWGENLSPDKEYTLVIGDYLANGGDDLNELKDLPKEMIGILQRDAIIYYIRKHPIINQKHELRVKNFDFNK